MFDVHATLSHLVVGKPLATGPLTMWPLLGANGGAPRYDLAADAFAAGTLLVTEVSEAGSVPTLRVQNAGPRPVLFIDGEHLIGAKQNRVLNVTVLVAANSTLDVPVSCVEQGRWGYHAPGFRGDDYLMNCEARALNMRHVSDTMRRRRSRAGNQGAVWDHLAEKAAFLHASSPTGAMRDTYDRHRPTLDHSVQRLAPVDHQVGAVFALHGAFSAVELFDSAATLKAMLPKLVRSHALEALDPRRTAPEPCATETLDEFIGRVRALRAEPYPAVGLGTEVRLEAERLHGAALIEDEQIVHLAVLAG